MCILVTWRPLFARGAHSAHGYELSPGPRHFLRQWRKFRGYTLEQAAERVGMTHQNLGKIERGKVPYNEMLLDLLADIYRTDRGRSSCATLPVHGLRCGRSTISSPRQNASAWWSGSRSEFKKTA
jgi:transcriptional regulator with XRE-family HTH domain